MSIDAPYLHYRRRPPAWTCTPRKGGSARCATTGNRRLWTTLRPETYCWSACAAAVGSKQATRAANRIAARMRDSHFKVQNEVVPTNGKQSACQASPLPAEIADVPVRLDFRILPPAIRGEPPKTKPLYDEGNRQNRAAKPTLLPRRSAWSPPRSAKIVRTRRLPRDERWVSREQPGFRIFVGTNRALFGYDEREARGARFLAV